MKKKKKKKNKQPTENFENLLRCKAEIILHKQSIDRILWKMKRNPIALLRMVFRRLPSMPAEKSYITLKRESLENFGLSGQFWADTAISYLREELTRLKTYVKDVSSSDYNDWEFYRSDDGTDDDDDDYPFGSPTEESESPFNEDEDPFIWEGEETDDNNLKQTLCLLDDVLRRLQSVLVDLERIKEKQICHSSDSEPITAEE